MLLGVYKLFAPSGDVDIYYFLLWLTIFFLGSTMIMLPHRAWGAEMSTDYHQRSRITAAREFYYLAGLMIAAAVPMAVEVMADGGSGVGDVLGKIWTDATGAFTGDIMNATPVAAPPYRAGSVWIGVDVDMAAATGGGDLLLCRERTDGIGHHSKSTHARRHQSIC